MSLLDTRSLDSQNIDALFSLTTRIKNEGWRTVLSKDPKLVSLVFLEPSTRTSSSFEVAALKSGHRVSRLYGDTSSTKKGETLLDTFLTLNAMEPDLFVVRHGTDEFLKDIIPQLDVPVINGGEGTSGHPTQSLLDAYTILESHGKVAGEKILIIGDVKHSRVANSGLELFGKLGAETAICGPEEWSVPHKRFESLEEGLRWSSVVMALRVQRERQGATESHEEELITRYQLNKQTINFLSKNAIILHPGPFNRGVELTNEVLNDGRCRIWNQVKNGTYLRGALMAQILGVSQ